MDDQEIPRLVPTAYDAHVFISGVEHQIPREGLVPGDGGAVCVLGMGATAVTDDILPAADIIEYPIRKTRAVHPEGPVGTCGGTACCSHLAERSPAVIPADLQAFATPEIMDLTHQLAGSLDHSPPLRCQVRGKRGQQILCRLTADGQVTSQGYQQF